MPFVDMTHPLPRAHSASRRLVHRTAGTLALAVLLAFGWPAPDGQAQTRAHSDITALLAGGQAQQALAQAEAALEATPRDPQLQFLKANAELALGRTEAADQTLTHLTQTYPELAEPWNNLATIRAAQGRLEEARGLLEQALRNNPDYAQAHANLADVLVRLAIGHLQTAERLAPQAQTAQRLQALQGVAGHAPASEASHGDRPQPAAPELSAPSRH